MKIAVGGKGGSGKTTVAGTLARVLADRGLKVVAVDDDSNPNLALTVGLPASAATGLPALPRDFLEERADAQGNKWLALAEGDDRRPRRRHHDGGAFGRRSAPGPDAELSGAGLSRARGNPPSGPSRGAATGERRSGPMSTERASARDEPERAGCPVPALLRWSRWAGRGAAAVRIQRPVEPAAVAGRSGRFVDRGQSPSDAGARGLPRSAKDPGGDPAADPRRPGRSGGCRESQGRDRRVSVPVQLSAGRVVRPAHGRHAAEAAGRLARLRTRLENRAGERAAGRVPRATAASVHRDPRPPRRSPGHCREPEGQRRA